MGEGRGGDRKGDLVSGVINSSGGSDIGHPTAPHPPPSTGLRQRHLGGSSSRRQRSILYLLLGSERFAMTGLAANIVRFVDFS